MHTPHPNGTGISTPKSHIQPWMKLSKQANMRICTCTHTHAQLCPCHCQTGGMPTMRKSHQAHLWPVVTPVTRKLFSAGWLVVFVVVVVFGGE